MKTTTNLKMLLPEGKDPVNIGDLTGNFETLDTYLADVQKATSDASKMPVIFSQAADRQNIASTEMLSTIMGKIARFFSDIKAAAFCAIANNDNTTAEGYVADARIVKTHGDEIDALKTSTNNSVSSLEKAISENKSSISSLNSNLANFQHGVDALYNQIVSLGVTPSGKTLDAVKNSISTVSNNSYNTGYAKGSSDGYSSGYSVGVKNATITTVQFGMTVYNGNTGSTNAHKDGFKLVGYGIAKMDADVADNTDCRNCACSCTLVGEVIQCYFYAGDGDKNSHGVFTINAYYQPS